MLLGNVKDGVNKHETLHAMFIEQIFYFINNDGMVPEPVLPPVQERINAVDTLEGTTSFGFNADCISELFIFFNRDLSFLDDVHLTAPRQ